MSNKRRSTIDYPSEWIQDNYNTRNVSYRKLQSECEHNHGPYEKLATEEEEDTSEHSDPGMVFLFDSPGCIHQLV